MKRNECAVLLLGFLGASVVVDAAAPAQQPLKLDIQPQAISDALNDFARQSGLQVVIDPKDGEGIRTSRLMGTFTARNALTQLLADTGLQYEYLNERTVAVRVARRSEPGEKEEVSEAQAAGRVRPLVLAQAHVQSRTEGTTRTDPSSDIRSASALEEVVVTARKRDETLQDVPISILVASGEDLTLAQIDGLNELHRIVPNLVLTEQLGGGLASLSLRGLGTLTFNTAGIDPTISTVVDGVVSGTTAGGGLTNFSDIERIEVLRGPQGTLFGKNSSGGVVHIITKDPTEELATNLGIDYSPTHDHIKTTGSLSGPLVDDKLLGRISFFTNKRDGFVKNLTDGRMLGDDDQTGVRGKLLFRPWETTRLELTGFVISRDQADSFEYPVLRTVGDDSFALVREFNSDLASTTNDKARGIGRTSYEDEIRGVNLHWDQALGGGYTLTSLTAYQDWKFDNNPDRQVPFNEVPAAWVQRSTIFFDQHQWSQELRLASPTDGVVDYVAGVYLFNQSIVQTKDQILNGAAIGVPGLFGLNHSREDVETLSYAAFGEANLHLLDSVTLTAGVRWTREEKEYDHRLLPLVPPEGATDTFVFQSSALPDVYNEAAATELTWRAGIQWQPSEETMLYGSVATGFKGPAYNTNAGDANFPTELLRVDPETSINYELGWRSSLLSNRIRTSLVVFLTELDDFQADGIESTVLEATGEEISFFLLRNAEKVETKGVEFEVQAAPWQSVMLNFNMAYTDAQYARYTNALCYLGQTVAQGCVDGTRDLSGTRLARAPKWSFNTSAQYEWQLATVPAHAFARLEYNWRDEMQWGFNGEPTAAEDPVGLLGASIGIRGGDGRYTLKVYGKNLTDEFHTSGIVGGAVGSQHFLGLNYQRSWGVSFNYDFY